MNLFQQYWNHPINITKIYINFFWLDNSCNKTVLKCCEKLQIDSNQEKRWTKLIYLTKKTLHSDEDTPLLLTLGKHFTIELYTKKSLLSLVKEHLNIKQIILQSLIVVKS